MIRTGQVTVNGVTCDNLATTVEPNDVVKLGNRVLRTSAPVTLILNKPVGFLCTAADTHARQTIFDLLPPNFPRLFHVGRLDRESEGLLIVTNDGDLALKLTHPKYKVEKEYEVVLDHAFDFELASKLLHGISLEDGWAKMESVHRLGSNKVKVVLRQGMKRQIRLMFYALGYEVVKLNRVRIGPIELQKMPLGSWRVLTQKEIDSLLAEGAKTSAVESGERRVRKPKPAFLRPGGPGKRRKDLPSSRGQAEEIPFVPRASRENAPSEAPAERPRSPRPAGRPASKFAAKPAAKSFGKKPFGAKSGKSAGKPAAKRSPRAFAKFERRRSDG